MTIKKLWLNGLLLAAPLGGITSGVADDFTAPSSSQTPYIIPTRPAVYIESILTSGDSVNTQRHTAIPYAMVGIPDGLGAFDNDEEKDEDDRDGRDNRHGPGTFTLLMNHEIDATKLDPFRGIPRDHGFNGAFVSKWIIEKKSLTVLEGEDLMKTVKRWDNATQSYLPLAGPLSRFCSGDLPALSAFYNKKTRFGYKGRIYMNGEESGIEGRAFAHFLDGSSFELPSLGKFSWENSVAHPATGDKTIVVGTDDGTGGQVYIYSGDKSSSPDDLAAAGLKNGTTYAIKVDGLSLETDATIFTSGAFSVVNLGDVTALTGAQLEANTVAAGATSFNRPEDSCWDPSNLKDLYFVTTASFAGKSRLWRMRFVDPANPELGGTATVLLDGTTGPKMMDNITINRRGKIILQEDVGNQAHIGKIWSYTIATGALEMIAQHDPARFTLGAPGFLTQDEESSGVIAMDDILGEGWFLLDVQAHYTIAGELYEGGQLLAMHIPSDKKKK